MTTRVRTHVNPLTFIYPLEEIELDSYFESNTHEYEIEIGFGRGIFIEHYATQNPNKNIIGVEVRKPLVEELNKRCKEKKISNILAIHGSDKQLFKNIIKDNSITKCFIFHPDPWLKNRHHKRRIINQEFLSTVYKKLKSNGKLYISTDVESLFEDMCTKIENSKLFKKATDTHFWENNYSTHWDKFSKKENRSRNKIIFTKI